MGLEGGQCSEVFGDGLKEIKGIARWPCASVVCFIRIQEPLEMFSITLLEVGCEQASANFLISNGDVRHDIKFQVEKHSQAWAWRSRISRM